MWNDGNPYMANTSTLAKPIINALGMDFPRGFLTVSYTHLTLPTSDLV